MKRTKGTLPCPIVRSFIVMPKDTSVLPIQWKYLSLDESENDKCRTTVEMFALCRNKPSTYRALLGYYYEIKNPAKRLTPDSDQKGPIRHYVQEWNRVATEARVGCHPLNEDGCSYGPLEEGSSRSRPHRVCQRPVGPGRTVEHWINRRLATRLFPFLNNPQLWVEPPNISQQKRTKRALNNGERLDAARKKPRIAKKDSTPSTREPTPSPNPTESSAQPSSMPPSESDTENDFPFSIQPDETDIAWENFFGSDPMTAFSMWPELDACVDHAQNIVSPSVDEHGVDALIGLYKPLAPFDNDLKGAEIYGSEIYTPEDGYLPEEVFEGSVELTRWRPDRPRFDDFYLVE